MTSFNWSERDRREKVKREKRRKPYGKSTNPDHPKYGKAISYKQAISVQARQEAGIFHGSTIIYSDIWDGAYYASDDPYEDILHDIDTYGVATGRDVTELHNEYTNRAKRIDVARKLARMFIERNYDHELSNEQLVKIWRKLNPKPIVQSKEDTVSSAGMNFNLIRQQMKDRIKEIDSTLNSLGEVLSERSQIIKALSAWGEEVPEMPASLMEITKELISETKTTEPKRKKGSPTDDERLRSAPKHRFPRVKTQMWTVELMVEAKGAWRTSADLAKQMVKNRNEDVHEYFDYWRSSFGRELNDLHNSGYVEKISAPGTGSFWQFRFTEKGWKHAEAMLGKEKGEDPNARLHVGEGPVRRNR